MRMLRTLGSGLLLAAGLAACAGRWGAIRYDSGVGQLFETAQVLPGHRYYTTGSEGMPDAILALREDRPLRSRFWREVPMSRTLLVRLVDGMRGSRDPGPYGSVVLDEDKTPIGVWYSDLKPMPVKLLADGGVIVSPPGDFRDSLGFPLGTD